MMKNEPPKNGENIHAQYSITNPIIRSPLPEEIPFITAPELPFKIPFVSDERARSWAFSAIVFRYYSRYWVLRIARNPYFISLYILSMLGLFTSMRSFYKDQMVTYGLRTQLPGIAHQLQTQNWPTFHFVTCPEIVLESHRILGLTFRKAKSSHVPALTEPFLYFLDSPFLERLDFYPNAALIQFSNYWTELLTNSFIGAWTANSADHPVMALPTIPQNYVITTLHPLEFASSKDRTVRDLLLGNPIVDPWGPERLRLDLSDELPSKMQDGWNRDQRRIFDTLEDFIDSFDEHTGAPVPPKESVVPAPLLMNGYARFREYQKSRPQSSKATVKPTYSILRKTFINWVFSTPNLPDYSAGARFGIGFAPPRAARSTPSSDSPHIRLRHSARPKKRFWFLRSKKKTKLRLKFPRISPSKVTQYAQNRKRRNRRLHHLFVDPIPKLLRRIFTVPGNPEKDPMWGWWHRTDANWNIQPPLSMAASHLMNMFDRIPPADTTFYTKQKRPILPVPPKNPYPKFQFQKQKSTKLSQSPRYVMRRLANRLIAPLLRIDEIRMHARSIRSLSDEKFVLQKPRKVISAASTRRKYRGKKLPYKEAVKVVSPSLRKMLHRLRSYRLAVKAYVQKKRAVTKTRRQYDAIAPTVKDFRTFWDYDVPKALAKTNVARYQTVQSIRRDVKTIQNWAEFFGTGKSKDVTEFFGGVNDQWAPLMYATQHCPDSPELFDFLKKKMREDMWCTEVPMGNQVLIRNSLTEQPLIELPMIDAALTGDVWKRILRLFTGRVVKTAQPTVADFRALTRMIIGTKLTKGQAIRDDSIRKSLQKQLRKAEKKGYKEFYQLLQAAGVGEGPTVLHYPATKPFVKFNASRQTLTKAQTDQFYPLLRWFYESYLKAQHMYNEAKGSEASSKLIKRVGEHSLWRHCLDSALTQTPLHAPKGNVFHWFHYLHQLSMIMNEPDAIKLLAQDLKQTTSGWLNPANTTNILDEDQLRGPDVTILRAVEVLNGQTDELHQMKLPENFLEEHLIPRVFGELPRIMTELFGRIPLTQEMRQKYPNGVKLAQAFSRMNMYAQVFTELQKFKSHSSAFQSVPTYRDAFARVTPEMVGYFFPDMEGETHSKAFRMSWFRYKLGRLSLWEAFRTMTKVRPLEVVLPPGFRFYNADIFGVPTGLSPHRKDVVRTNIFPSYQFERTKCELPPYEILQEIYGDLDVSFLALPPKPGLPFLADGYVTQHMKNTTKVLMRSMEALKEAKEKEIQDLQDLIKSGLASKHQRSELPRLKANLKEFKKTEYRPLQQEALMLDQPNYFEFDRALVRKNGDVDVPVNIVNWLHDFLLSPMNWMKDRIYFNFMGQAGFLRGEITTPVTEALQHRQMGVLLFDKLGTIQDAADALVAPELKKTLPSVIDGYEAQAFVDEESFVEQQVSSQIEKDDVAKDLPSSAKLTWEQVAEEYFAEDKETDKFANTMPQKYHGQLHTIDRLYMPQLTMTEWHNMYKAILGAGKDHPEAGIVIQIPFLSQLPGSRPVAFTGKINPRGSLIDPKIRARALAQVLMLATHPYYGAGAANDLEYRRLQAVDALPPSSGPGFKERKGAPIVWHYRVPFGEVCPETLGAPTILHRIHKRQQKLQTRTWLDSKNYMAELQGKKPKRPDRNYPSWFINLVQLFPQGRVALNRNKSWQSNREPIHMYWWFVAAKVYFFAVTFETVKLITYVVGKGTLYRMALRLPRRSQRQKFRDFFLLIGVIKDERIRVIYDTPRRFTDLMGMSPELMARAGDIVLHLRNKRRPGGPAIPKGLLLAGPPGTGKTYLVQAIAGEAGVPVVAQSTNMYLDKTKFMSPVYGLSTSFARARKLAPSILFIDEIDGMGRAREQVVRPEFGPSAVRLPRTAVTHLTKGRPIRPSSYVRTSEEEFTIEERMKLERNQYLEDLQKQRVPEYERYIDIDPEPTIGEYFYEVLNVKAIANIQAIIRFALLIEFLVQIDGLKTYEGVLVIGATNRYNILDRAMVRPGRLEEIIFVQLPTFDQRTDIVKFYTAPFGYGSDVSDNWEYLAHRTRGYSIADIATAINQSAVHAIVNNRELHDLDTLDFGLDQVELHKRLRGNLVPHPHVKKVPALDPIYFARQAYYQAGRALIQNLLPTHPNLPYVTMEYLPFLPEQSLEKLYSLKLDRFEFEMRVAGLLAGKAAEYIFLYGTSFKSQKDRAERQLWESNCGVDELGFATDMALHVVDTWLMLDEVRLTLLQEMHASEDGDLSQIFRRRITEIPWLIETWLHDRNKDYTHLFSKIHDDPYRNRIATQIQHLTKWIGETKVIFGAAVGEFSAWWQFYLKAVFEKPTTRGWRVRDRFLHERPRHRHPITAKNSQGHHGWMWRGKHWVREDDAWTEKTDKWLVGLTPPNEINYFDQVIPLVSYNDWEVLDRDYMWTVLMTKSFDLVYQLLDQHRPLLDRMAQRLHSKGRLRQFEIDHFIEVYTDELKEMRRIDPYETEGVNRLAPIIRYEPNPVFYGPRRQGQLPSFLTVHNLDKPGGPFPYARQTHQQSIVRTRTTDELEDFLDMLSDEDKRRFQKQIHDYKIERQKQAAQGKVMSIIEDIFANDYVFAPMAYLAYIKNQIIQQYHLLATRDAHKRQKEIEDVAVVPPKPERKFHTYQYGPQGEFQIRGYRSLLDPDPEKPVTKEELAIVLYTPTTTQETTQGMPPSSDGDGQDGPLQNPEA